MKAEILSVLKGAKAPVSGQVLTRQLGISGGAVAGHMKILRDLGYPIIEGPSGYVLQGMADLLHPWEFPGREEKIHYYAQVTSTMDIARDLARSGCPGGTVVIAESQASGRGRLKRVWHSVRGGLYFTVVLRPDLPVSLNHRVPFSASVALAQSLEELCGVPARVKWPNDILVGGKKLAGMLSEMFTEQGTLRYLNLGIGINVNNDPSLYEPNAIAVKDVLGKEFPRRDLLARFLDALDYRLAQMDREDVVALWKRYTDTLNRPVRIVTAHRTMEGRAMDVDGHGALILELPDGSRERVLFGDCFHTEAI